MAGANHEEIIALCEDPTQTFDDVSGETATPKRLNQISELSDSLFYQCGLDEKVWDTLHLPVHISVRRLARLSHPERTEILSRLPSDLAEEIASLLPVGAS